MTFGPMIDQGGGDPPCNGEMEPPKHLDTRSEHIWMQRSFATSMDKLLTKAGVTRIPREHRATFEVATTLKTSETLGLGIPQVVPTQTDRAIR